MAFFSDADWILCTDGKARPIEPGTFPLAHGQPNRVGRLRAYGNAMHRAKITQFILAADEAIRSAAE
jgi:DNA (cytosine-5)-methyltransferase 1